MGRFRRRWTWLGVGVVVVGAAATTVALWPGDQPPHRPSARCTTGEDLIVAAIGTGTESSAIHVLSTTHSPKVLAAGWNARHPSISPDGRKIVVTRAFDVSNEGAGPAAEELWVLDLGGSRPVRLTHGVRATQPSWSPDGGHVVFVGNDKGSTGYLATVAADGTGTPQQLRPVQTTGDQGATSPRWSPDGSRIAFGRGRQVVIIDADDGHAISTADTQGLVASVIWDPDGTSVTVVVVNDPEVSPHWSMYRVAVATGRARPLGAGFQARWSTDGKRLYVLDIAHERPRILVSSATPGSQRPSSAQELDPPLRLGLQRPDRGFQGFDVGPCT